MSAAEISHIGRITAITPSVTTVEIVSESACASCHAKSLCSIGGSSRKTIEVPSVPGFETGEEVMVMLRRSMGFKAVIIAYVFPLVVLVSSLLILVGAGVPELAAGLSSIAATALCYLAIWLAKDRISKEYSFYINKK